MNSAINTALVADEAIVNIQGLNKCFANHEVLRSVDLKITRGHIVGLIGPNSSGKSTLLRHLPGIYLPTGGKCRVFGIDAAALADADLARIGYVHQEGELMDWMTTQQIIRYVASHYPTWNSGLEQELVRRFELNPGESVAVMSPGQRQKLSIVLAVCFEPELLILDEPASALDPIARKTFLELLLGIIQDQSRSIIISSHILSDIEKVIDHVLIMNRGELVRNCSFDDLLEEFVKLEITALSGQLPTFLPFRNVLSCERDNKQAVVIIPNTGLPFADLEVQLDCSIKPLPLRLEEIYPLVMSQHNGAMSAAHTSQEVQP